MQDSLLTPHQGPTVTGPPIHLAQIATFLQNTVFRRQLAKIHGLVHAPLATL